MTAPSGALIAALHGGRSRVNLAVKVAQVEAEGRSPGAERAGGPCRGCLIATGEDTRTGAAVTRFNLGGDPVSTAPSGVPHGC